MSSALARQVQPAVVQAEIDFLLPDLERPFTYSREVPPGAEAETARFATHAVQIQDLRDAVTLRLDEHGATLGHWPTRVRRFYDESHVRARYYPESADIIKAALGADRVVVFDPNVRRCRARLRGAISAAPCTMRILTSRRARRYGGCTTSSARVPGRGYRASCR